MSAWRRAITSGPGRRGVGTGLLGIGAALAVAACGASSAARRGDGPAPTATSVTAVTTNVTAQMLPAAATPSSPRDEARFTLTATDRDGRPAADQPVTFWIGPMFPRCGTPIRSWYEVGGADARRFVARASTRTDAEGQATLTLLGQMPRTMEMVALRVGDLSSFGDGHGNGLLDAWWTRRGVSPTAPIGDRVTISPFLTDAAVGSDDFHVRVAAADGRAVSDVHVSFSPDLAGGTRTSPRSGVAVLRRTDAAGDATFAYPTGTQGTLYVKVYRPSGALYSGAMTAETVRLG